MIKGLILLIGLILVCSRAGRELLIKIVGR